MNKQTLRFTLYAIIVYLTSGTLNPAAAYSNVDALYTVRLIYFLPSDRSPQQDIDTKLNTLIRDVQQFYAEQMESHGFGRKTFTFETNATGKAVVHHVDGQFTDSYYHQNTSHKVWEELAEQFDTPNHTYIVVIDTGIERIGVQERQVCGDASKKKFFMPGSGPCFSFYVIAHELGHTFGLRHDFRSNAYMLSYGITSIRGRNRDRISKCAAEWLDVHRFFNSSQTLFNEPTTIQMLPPLAYSPKAIRLRFEVTDADGLHQAQLIIPTTAEDPARGPKLHGCKRLNGESNTIEFITTELTVEPATEVSLHVIDVHGSITRRAYAFTKTDVLPDPNDRTPTILKKISGDNQDGLFITPLPNPLVVKVTDQNGIALEEVAVTFAVTAGSGTLNTTHTTTDENGRAESTLTLGPNLGTNTVEVSAAGIEQTVIFNAVAGAGVDIPDPNLRAAIATILGKALGDPIAPSEMATLTEVNAKDASISDLTGLEFGTNLTALRLHDNHITDISVLSELTKLQGLWLSNSNITDISALSDLIHLRELGLGGNNITDISALANLVDLTSLKLWNNSIADISSVENLTQLTRLHLHNNRITNISVLSGLTQLTELRLNRNNITDLSPLVANTGLGNGDQVLLNDNPLSYLSIKTHISTLQGRGVAVEFDDATHLNFGEPRTVRMIYFLPNDRPYRADVVQRMKDEIHAIQTFYAEQMEVHGYGEVTFRVETDFKGEPMVHRVDGRQPNSHYFYYMESKVRDEIVQAFNLDANLYLIIMDTDVLRRNNGQPMGGTGHRYGKIGGYALVSGEFHWETVAHELGHAFGLFHDFNDSTYIMSYGLDRNRLSACHAEYLTMNPYFNPDVPIEVGRSPIIELISPRTYPAGSKSVPIQLKISDSEGLYQMILFATTRESHAAGVDLEVKTCRGLAGKKEAIVEFDYDGVIPSDSSTSLANPIAHPISVEVVDTDGNVTQTDFVLFSEVLQPLMKISGDNQTGLPNTPLPVPFVIEVRNLNDGSVRSGVSVTFTITAGDGTPNVEHTNTDYNGRAESTLTLGQHLGTTTVEASAAEIEGTVTFTAMAGAAVDLPGPNLRTAIETALGVAPGDPIAPAEMATLTRLEAPNANISDLTGLEFATNLTELSLGPERVGNEWRNSNAVSDLSPLAGLTRLTRLHLPNNSISDISAVADLTNLTWLNLWGNSISAIFPVAGLTKLTDLYLGDNNISDISPLAANTGLGSGDTVNVKGNPLSYLSIHTHIPALQSKGVTVEFDNRAHPALLKISGDNQKGSSFASLPQPFVVEAQDENGSALTGVSVRFAVTAGGGVLSTTITRTNENGRAQSTLTLGPNLGTNTVEVSATGIEGTVTFHAISDTESPPITADVNNDGSVNILDLVVIASDLGNAGTNLAADVNGDGVVNILDLILVAGMFDGAAAAPSAQPQVPETLTAVEVQGWLTDARSLKVRDPIMKRGFVVLEQLLVSLTPRRTKLLANYPNPFNPETWIPYRLAEDAFVTLTIYDGSGRVVRTLGVGHRIASAYENRSKAIYWDGRNGLGEQVASGVYFYTLTAGDYSATRKMLVVK